MKSGFLKLLFAVLCVAGLSVVGLRIWERLQEQAKPAPESQARPPAPVEVAPIERGTIALKRTFSGALEAIAEFVVAPKVAGRVEQLTVDISDSVKRGQVVAWLDDAEFAQAVALADADLAVAEANLVAAKSALEIAERALERVGLLRTREMATETEFDAAQAEQQARQAQLAVALAQITRAESVRETARIRLGYTKVTAGWTGGNEERVVAERFVDEGETVGANTPLLSIVELDPVTGVIFVPERDYARMHDGQAVVLATDAYPGEEFPARIERIAPVFRQTTRQARVELTVENRDQRLKPGMFIRATVVLERLEDAVIVPYAALTERQDRTGLFLVDAAGMRVSWREVEVGIREEDRVQITGDGLEGRVVTLGQQMVDDGSLITIPDNNGAVQAEAGRK